MLLTAVRDEFSFHCQCRNLSPRTIKNYLKQIDYLLRFLRQEHKVIHIEDVEPKQIKEFLLSMRKSGRTPNHINDLLKAYKVFFRYAFNRNCKVPVIERNHHYISAELVNYHVCQFIAELHLYRVFIAGIHIKNFDFVCGQLNNFRFLKIGI